jgi:F0F1-type ATP synthase membrane subunit b/b'
LESDSAQALVAGLGVILVMVLFIVIAAVIIVVIWQVFGTRRAMAVVARDEAYRKLAEQSAEAQQHMMDDLADLRQRVASIEKLLKEID